MGSKVIKGWAGDTALRDAFAGEVGTMEFSVNVEK